FPISVGSESVEMTFRVTDMSPELWHAGTGATEQVSYQLTEQGVVVPLKPAADEAVFVVFRKSAKKSLTEFILASCGYEDIGSFTHKLLGRRQTNSATATGDDCNL